MDDAGDVDDSVAAAVTDAFPDRAVAAIGHAGPSWNDANETARVDFADGERAYVKVGVDGDDSRVRRERAVLELVRERTTVPVPAVVASDVDRDRPYLVTAAMDGETLVRPWGDRDRDGRLPLARSVGRSLAHVHALRFDAARHIEGGGADGLAVDAAPWPDVLADRVSLMRSLASTDRLDEHFDRVRDAVEANRGLLADAPVALAHGDPAMPNCVWDGDRVGLLDWEIAYVGDPARDLYRARSQQFDGVRSPAPEPIVAAFHDGYRSVAGGLPEGYETRLPVYEAVGFLKTSGYVDRLAAFADEDEADLAAWANAEMDRRLDALQ